MDCFTRFAMTLSIYTIQNSAGTNKLTLDASGNLNLSGEWNIASGNTYKINGTSILSSTSLASSVVNSSLTSIGVLIGSDPLQITNSGNVNFKMTGGSYTYRMEVQIDDEFYLWDGAKNEVFHVSSDNQVWFQSDVNCAGTYYDSGIPIVPSSRSLKPNIRDLPKDKLLDKVQFKQYTKTYKEKTYEEVGIIIEDLLEITGIGNYDLVHTKEIENTKFLKYVPFFMIMISEMRDEINELKGNSK